MKEAFVVLLVILVLLALTAFRYRKQIRGLIGVARMLKDAKEQVGRSRAVQGEQSGVQLVNCATCGVWIPQNKAVSRHGKFFCSAECAKVPVT
jgi:cbb3-type cytochrome oxidase subunit 3